MERLSATTLPAGYSFEWTGTALQEKAAAGQTSVVLGLAVIFAYLFLVALYESWNVPIPVLLSTSVGILGAIAAIWLSGLARSEEHTAELQSLMRISYAVFCLK